MICNTYFGAQPRRRFPFLSNPPSSSTATATEAMYIGGLQNFLSYVNPLNPILTVTKQPILCSSVPLPIAGMDSSGCHIRKAPNIHLSTERWNSSGPRTNPNERAATHSQIPGADRHGTDWAGAVKLRRGYPKGNDTSKGRGMRIRIPE